MLRSLDPVRVRQARFTPAAIVDRPIAWFRAFGIDLVHDRDDLDDYQFAGVEGPDGLTFGLLHHAGEPRDRTTLLLPERVASQPAALRPMILAFSRLFDLSPLEFHWNEPDRLT